MTPTSAPDRRATAAGRPLATALRGWRERLDPESFGLMDGAARRAPGLRREELAMLAGISADYVTRLEQGRASSPSEQIVTALAEALRLAPSERRHLFLLAGHAPGEARFESRITPSVARLLERLAGTPVSVYDPTWNLVTWNRPYVALFGDPDAAPARAHNPAWRQFVGGDEAGETDSAGYAREAGGAVGIVQITHDPELRDRLERALVADLRTTLARYPGDDRPGALVEELYARGPRFAALWDAPDVDPPPAANSKTAHHPELGAITLDCDLLTVPDADLRVVAHTAPPGTPAAAALDRLASDRAR